MSNSPAHPRSVDIDVTTVALQHPEHPSVSQLSFLRVPMRLVLQSAEAGFPVTTGASSLRHKRFWRTAAERERHSRLDLLSCGG